MAATRAILLCILAVLAAAPAAAKPSRVVSMFLCTDDLVLRLAERRNIASVSYWAANPATSTVTDLVGDVPLNHGLAEEILPLEPDLILSGEFTARGTTQLLRRLGYRVEVIPVAATLDDVRANIRRVAALLREDAKGAAMVARFDARLQAAIAGIPEGPRPLAAFYWTGGYSAGSGTLADDVIRAAGFRNYAHAARFGPAGRFPLERVVTAPVDLLILAQGLEEEPSQARATLRHPALLAVRERLPSVTLPRRLFACGSPATLEAVEQLAAARRRLESR